jgi:hypothetical protein
MQRDLALPYMFQLVVDHDRKIICIEASNFDFLSFVSPAIFPHSHSFPFPYLAASDTFVLLLFPFDQLSKFVISTLNVLPPLFHC